MNQKKSATFMWAIALALVICAASAGKVFAAAADSLDQLYEKAKKEGKVTLYAPLSPTAMSVIPPAFMKRFPGVAVDHIDATSDKLIARVLAEQRGGRVIADVISGALSYLPQILDLKIVEHVAIPEAAAYPSQLKGDLWVATDTQYYIAGWNTNLVKKGDEPKSYEELANAKWKDNIMGAAAITSESAPHTATVGRHPNGSASRGSARPLTRIEPGIADCFTPKASPWRSTGTSSVRNRLIAGCAPELASPATTSRPSRTGREVARAAIVIMHAPLVRAATRIEATAPVRWAARPSSPDPNAPAAKKTLVAAAAAARLTSRSERICSESTPTRKPGSTVTVPTPIASADARVKLNPMVSSCRCAGHGCA